MPTSLHGPAFERFHTELAKYNGRQLEPAFPDATWREELDDHARVSSAQRANISRRCGSEISPLSPISRRTSTTSSSGTRSSRIPAPAKATRFPLAGESATREDMLWFLTQEVAGEAGFDDLLAMTQVKMPVTAKLEMARNYWDEMGRGRETRDAWPAAGAARQLSRHRCAARAGRRQSRLRSATPCWRMARSRRYCFHSIGALGVIEMTAPTRAGFVDAGLKRLRIPTKKRLYFTLHAVLDIKHSECWNREVLRSLVAEDPRCAAAIGEGAMIRLVAWRALLRALSAPFRPRCAARARPHKAEGSEPMRFLGIGDAADLADRSIFGSPKTDTKSRVYIGNPLLPGHACGPRTPGSMTGRRSSTGCAPPATTDAFCSRMSARAEASCKIG